MSKKVIFILSLIVVFIGVFFLVFRRRPATLLYNAHQIKFGEPWIVGSCNYFWLSRQDVLLLEQGSVNHFGEPTIKAFRINAKDSARQELQALENLLNSKKASAHVRNWQVSPDGRWLLAENDPNAKDASWIALTLDGSRVVTLPHQADVQEYSPYDTSRLIHAVWEPDSKGWVQAVENQTDHKVHVYWYDLDEPMITEHEEDFMLYDRNVIGYYNSNRLLAVNQYTGDRGAIGFADFSAPPTSQPRALYFQYVPANMNAREAALSPLRDRIAWIFEVKSVPFGIDALRNSNYVRREKPILVGLWTSKLDCSDLHEIGTLDARDDNLSDLRWTPDGKQISFMQQGALYTVPAN